MFDDKLSYTGEVTISLIGPDGVVAEQRKANMVVASGRVLAINRLANSSQSVLTHAAIGSGAIAPAEGNTALGAELARVAFDTAGGVIASATVTYSATIPAGTGTGTVAEAGLFNAVSGGTMFARVTFAPITKTATHVVVISWGVTAV